MTESVPEATEATEAPPLTGLRVVSCGAGPALGLATMILADFGATVRRYTDPEYQVLDDVPSARMWLRGSAPGTDLAGDLNWADVVLLVSSNGFPALSEGTVRRANPQAICAVLEAGEVGSALPPYDAVLAAKTGRMQNLTGILPTPQPHFAAVPVAVHASAQNLVAGILAALFQRRQGSAGGQVLRTSLIQGLMPYDQGQSLLEQLHPDRRQPDPGQLMPTLNYHPVQCADGRWLQLGNLLPHLFENFLRLAGIEEILDWLPDERERARDLILETMQRKTAAEWMTLFEADGGVAAHPYLRTEETLRDPDMTANGHVVELNGVKQLGPLARLTVTPARITAQAKEAGATRWAPAGDTEPEELPLRGVTVLELATIIASPLGASFLADMGARVIKVETLGGDPFRHMGGGIGATRCNQGKESISVDLKTAAGREIVQALAEQADILIHNFRPGVPERLGIDYETLEALNPRLVYLSANGYGPLGPGALRPSTHPIPGAAMGGAAYQAGGAPEELLGLQALREWSRRLMRANEVNPDPNTAVVVMTASLLGLVARSVTGRGQQVFVDMFCANAYANFDALLEYSGKAPRPSLGAGLTGPHPLYRLYPAEDSWVFLGIRRPVEWETFCQLTGFSTIADPFAEVTGKLAAELEALFRGDAADHWEALLSPAGIGCVRADTVNTGEFFAGPGAEAWMSPVAHPELGDYRRHRPMVEFAAENDALEAGVRCGVHGPALLRELGFTDARIDALFEEGLLYSADRERPGAA
ncbi:MAG: CoA transferase [Pseudomonadota bacterium]